MRLLNFTLKIPLKRIFLSLGSKNKRKYLLQGLKGGENFSVLPIFPKNCSVTRLPGYALSATGLSWTFLRHHWWLKKVAWTSWMTFNQLSWKLARRDFFYSDEIFIYKFWLLLKRSQQILLEVQKILNSIELKMSHSC